MGTGIEPYLATICAKLSMFRDEIRASFASQSRAASQRQHPNWLDVCRRAGDDAENFTGRSLLLQRLLELVKQPNVLDGNDCLIGEGFEELICAGVNGRTSMRRAFSAPMNYPLLTKRNDQERVASARWTRT